MKKEYKVRLRSPDGLKTIWAHAFRIGMSGALIFYDEEGETIAALAAGFWENISRV